MATVGIINNTFSPRKIIEFGLVATLGKEISYTQVRSYVWLDFSSGLKTFAKCFIGQMEDVIRHSKLICLSRKFFKQKKLSECMN